MRYVLDDFLEIYEEELNEEDKKEVGRLRENPYGLIESYLFKRIEPSCLPYFCREKTRC